MTDRHPSRAHALDFRLPLVSISFFSEPLDPEKELTTVIKLIAQREEKGRHYKWEADNDGSNKDKTENECRARARNDDGRVGRGVLFLLHLNRDVPSRKPSALVRPLIRRVTAAILAGGKKQKNSLSFFCAPDSKSCWTRLIN